MGSPRERRFTGTVVRIVGSTAMVGDFAVLDDAGELVCLVRRARVDLAAFDGRKVELAVEVVDDDDEAGPPIVDVTSVQTIC